METKICELKGYTIVYNTRDKLFHLRNAENEEVGSGKTQEEVEKQADKLAKQVYHFPIQALIHAGNRLEQGKVTSLNIEDESIRFVYANKRFYHNHTKNHLRFSKVYELTEHNKEILRQVNDKEAKVRDLEAEISALIEHLDKRIDLAYFNLSDS